eukprot:Colp12_sorted_trinity150504_noHs@15474
MVCEQAALSKAEFVVLGSGRSNREAALGSIAHQCLQQLNSNLIIVNANRAMKPIPESLKFLCCIDGTDASLKAVDKVAPYAILPHTADGFAVTSDKTKEKVLAETIQARIIQHKLKGSATTKEANRNTNVGVDILQHVDTSGHDVIVVGYTGKLGSVASYVVKNGETHVIVVKTV